MTLLKRLMDEEGGIIMATHDGHRHRMRERFIKEGLEGFAPHEVLELLLFYGRTRGDVNPLAHQLLDTFGTLKGVLEARPEQLMSVKGIGEESATLISLAVPLFRRYQACIREDLKVLGGMQDVKNYCLSLLVGSRVERFYVLCLDIRHHLLGQRMVAEGSLADVYAYPRKIIETALNYNAHSVILCHNHPGGTLTPSEEDLKTTWIIKDLLDGLEMPLVDHLIVARDSIFSMTQHDLLERPANLALQEKLFHKIKKEGNSKECTRSGDCTD